MKPLIELSAEQYETLLKRATPNSRLYSRLTTAAKTQKTIAILCELHEAKMLLHVTKTFCPDAVQQIEKQLDSLGSLDSRAFKSHDSGRDRAKDG
jgi:thiamine kinase-like enzyme